jgi:hypothetical protein
MLRQEHLFIYSEAFCVHDRTNRGHNFLCARYFLLLPFRHVTRYIEGADNIEEVSED